LQGRKWAGGSSDGRSDFGNGSATGRKTVPAPSWAAAAPPSKLGEVQPDHWPAECTTDLIDLLNVLGLLVDPERDQARLPDRMCSGPLLPISELHERNALETPPERPRKTASRGQGELFERG